MATEQKVKEGECISSIAHRYGHFWETLWDDPGNSELRELRKDPNVLQPGDVVMIPDKKLKEESGAEGKRHRFRLKGVPARFQLTLQENGEARADVEYVLEIDGELHRGRTDDEGKIDHPLPRGARRGKLILDEEEEYVLDFGDLDPVEEERGAIQRLDNLGYLGSSEGDTQAAIRQFQEEYGLELTGDLDDATRDALVTAHGS